MYKITLQDIARDLGSLYIGNDDLVATDVTFDSRQVKEGSLFIALDGNRHNGHDYIDLAIENGAAGIVVSDMAYFSEKKNGFVACLFAEEGGEKFLQELAKWCRQRFSGEVIAITGSQGKTSTKDLLGQILASKANVVFTGENQNNELGLPLTMTRLNDNTDILILEMGMDHEGDIHFLADIAQPTQGVITGIGLAHAEQLGSREGIAKAKAELFAHIPASGNIFLHEKDYEWLSPHLEESKAPITWCCRQPNCVDERHDCVAYNIKLSTDTTAFRCTTKNGEDFEVEVPFAGEHHIDNTLLCIAVASSMGYGKDVIQEEIMHAEVQSANRMTYHLLRDGRLLINDSYNANPDSMKATLEVLARYKPKFTVACLGDMLELGPYEKSEHENLGVLVAELGIDVLVTVGERASDIARIAGEKGMAKDAIYPCLDNACAVARIELLSESNSVILVKGSHSMHMEEICTSIRDEDLRRDHTC